MIQMDVRMQLTLILQRDLLKFSVQNDNSNSTESHGVGGSVALKEYIETKVSLRDKRQKLRFI